jgi:transposase-like protein
MEVSFDETGEDLFTFLRFPKIQWKALRTTNALERIIAELRRRTKTQAGLPGQDAVLLFLFGCSSSAAPPGRSSAPGRAEFHRVRCQ